jgi:hypothetical protein
MLNDLKVPHWKWEILQVSFKYFFYESYTYRYPFSLITDNVSSRTLYSNVTTVTFYLITVHHCMKYERAESSFFYLNHLHLSLVFTLSVRCHCNESLCIPRIHSFLLCGLLHILIREFV